MKSKRLLLLVPAAAITGVVFAQGPLTPPSGPPAPAMKTLDQLEPRTPISSLPFTIISGGSYYFTRNMQFNAASGDAISISANDVTLDLMGFKLSSSGGVTGNAISIGAGLRNIAVRNGVIAGNTNVTITGTAPNQTWTVNPGGFDKGIDYEGLTTTMPRNSHFFQLRISACRTTGLSGAGSPLIEQVTASENGTYGIHALSGNMMNCIADSNGGSGIYLSVGSVMNCIAKSNGGDGILTGSVSNSVADSNGSDGIVAFDGRIANCGGKLNGGMGLVAANGSITHSTAVSNGSHGIYAPSGSVTHCTARANGSDGIAVSSGVIAFCKSTANNTNSNGSVDIDGTGSTRTGNHPGP